MNADYLDLERSRPRLRLFFHAAMQWHFQCIETAYTLEKLPMTSKRIQDTLLAT